MANKYDIKIEIENNGDITFNLKDWGHGTYSDIRIHTEHSIKEEGNIDKMLEVVEEYNKIKLDDRKIAVDYLLEEGEYDSLQHIIDQLKNIAN